MIYLQPITFYAILREMADPDRTEIAEHHDGAMKAYAEEWKAVKALEAMTQTWLEDPKPTPMEGWRVEEILMVPPPMTASYRRESIHQEIAQDLSGSAPVASTKRAEQRQRNQSYKRATESGSQTKRKS